MDIRSYPSGVLNNTIQGWPTHLGIIAPTGTDGYVWVAYLEAGNVGGTADTEANALDAIRDTWAESHPVHGWAA